MNVYCIPEYTPDVNLTYGSARVPDKNGRSRFVNKRYTHSAYTKEDLLYINKSMQDLVDVIPCMLDFRYEAAPSNQKKLDRWLKEAGIVDSMVLEGIEF